MSQEKTKLSRADRKQIEAAIAKAKNTDKRHKSAQDSIPFQRMFPDGICRVTDYYYSKTVQFQDINYQLNQNEDKTAIFDSWCDFLNYFDSSIHFQLSFVNLAANKDSYAQTIAIPPRADAFNQLRTEYTKMLQTQLARGNNGLVKTKFITFGVEADNLKTAKPRLERIEIDILNNFKRLGVQAEPLNGHDRLKLMHDVLHMDEQEPFRFSWDWLAPSGLSVKDFIAPSSFEFRTGSSFAVGKKYGRASFLQILAPELNDRMLADFLDMESSVIVSMHIQSVDQVKAIKTIKRKITDLDKMKIEEQKKAIRAGYDTDYINPMDLNLNYSDDENPLSLKSDFILSLCELIVGGKDGLMPVEKTIIDRCVRLVYRNYLNDPRPENMPILGDLYEELRKQDEKEAQYIATALEIYVTGSLNVFNHQTNVDVHSRVVAYDIKELGKQLKKIGMLIVQDQVWNRVTVNREAHKSTRYYIDEMHLLLKEEQTASYTIEIWKRFRKWGGMPTGITQNVKDLLSSREVENIFENSDYIYMLNQASGDRQILAKQLNISPHQLSYVTHSGEGEGLLFYGNIILPFVDRFPKDTELYRVLTTKPQEVSS